MSALPSSFESATDATVHAKSATAAGVSSDPASVAGDISSLDKASVAGLTGRRLVS